MITGPLLNLWKTRAEVPAMQTGIFIRPHESLITDSNKWNIPHAPVPYHTASRNWNKFVTIFHLKWTNHKVCGPRGKHGEWAQIDRSPGLWRGVDRGHGCTLSNCPQWTFNDWSGVKVQPFWQAHNTAAFNNILQLQVESGSMVQIDYIIWD